MCESCFITYEGNLVTPTVHLVALAHRIRAFCEQHPLAGPLHVQVEDMNLEDEFMRVHPDVIDDYEPEVIAEAEAILAELSELDLPHRAFATFYGNWADQPEDAST